MSYCLNPSCPKPLNHPKAKKCRACGSKLLLRNRYHLVKGLGKGGFGATFLAADLSLPGQPLCVIKQLRPNTDNPNFLSMARELFEREAKTLGKVGNHPQIPRLLDYFEDRQQFYLVQEFVKGNNLQQEVKKHGVLDEKKARQVLTEVSIILRDIHIQKVIHRDIKPANIIRREIDNKLVLIDFGVVKNQVNTIAAGNGDQTALTAFAVGTPGFAPPEQLAMRPVYASDVYALGVTCMYLMSGKAPKNIESDPLTGEIQWFKYIDVSDEFADILLTMLEVSVKNRYKTADEVLQALDMTEHLDDLSHSMVGFSSDLSEDKGNSGSHGQVASYSSRRTTSSRSRDQMGTRERTGSRSRANPKSRRNDSASRNRTASRMGTTRNTSERNNRGNPISRSQGRAQSQGRSNRVDSTGKNPPREIKKPIKVDRQTLLDSYAGGRRDFAGKDISLQNLQKANLSGSNFHHSRMIKVNFQGADLSSADFTGCDLRQGLLRNANLGRSYLSYANLEGTDLRGADLSFAHLKNTKLKGANLCGANLTSANITEEQLVLAKTNWTTVLPNGKRGFW
ncbi:serine/threonine protein kinase [Xenococcus sp. PCC 7305]|uniref:serine/threonine-protein kinase n=1 Tax=Xenococcus sp. PCC 7305 TaxID=102125 RepID=UPI0002ACC41B|nr:serine/threonine-protein kinase [Xenococcus sp. PCC 7305]ELS03219.1 serine/threonine protein kinase [Xenococcus sp. PCC 7305]